MLQMTNSSVAILPHLHSLGCLEFLDLENCSRLQTLPALPPKLDQLVISGCEHLHAVASTPVDPEPAAHASAASSGGVDLHVNSTAAASDSLLVEGRTPRQAAGVQDVLHALPQSLTEMHALSCPLFPDSAALAALSGFLVSNRLLQWERFREPSAFAAQTGDSA